MIRTDSNGNIIHELIKTNYSVFDDMRKYCIHPKKKQNAGGKY